MNYNPTITLILASFLTLSGCAQKFYVHPNPARNTPQQFEFDKSECTYNASIAFPQNSVQAPANLPESYNTKCTTIGVLTNCKTQPQANIAANSLLISQLAIDASQKAQRNDHIRSCLDSRGWLLKTPEELETDKARLSDKKMQFNNEFRDVYATQSAICEDPAVAAFITKSPCFMMTAPTIDQLADTSKANQTEKKAIKIFDGLVEQQHYLERVTEVITKYFSGINRDRILSAFAIHDRTTRELRIKLYSGQITWGQFNTETYKNYGALMSAIKNSRSK